MIWPGRAVPVADPMPTQDHECRIAGDGLARFDVRVGLTVYRGAALHGAGGPMQDSPRVVDRAHRMLKRDGVVWVYTRIAADGTDGFEAPADRVGFIRAARS